MADNVSLKIWDALKPMVDREIENRTRNCARMETGVITTAYNSATKTVGVTKAFSREIQLPVYSNLDTGKLTVGTSVWVLVPYSSWSNAIGFRGGNG